MERLNSLDASFVDAEDQDKQTSFAVAAVAVLDGPGPSYEEFLATLAGRLPLLPFYRKKLCKVPFRLGPPGWVDDPNFDLRSHVPHAALPTPGRDEQLGQLTARVMAQRLDRDHPLWECWLIDGLEQGRWAMIWKMHHCMIDGVSGSRLHRLIFDTSAEPSPPAVDDRPEAVEPSNLELAGRAALDAILLPVRASRQLSGALADPGPAVQRAAGALRGIARFAGSSRPAPRSSLTGHIGRQRRCSWARASLDDVKMIKRELGGSVNDVVLAAVSSGFRDLLLGRREELAPSMVRSLIPVSVRGDGDLGSYGNHFSAVVADLPVHVADPIDRLAAVRYQMSHLKASNEATVGEAIVSLGQMIPFPLASMSVRLALSLPQREVVTVTTNVPGPPQPLYALGRRLVDIIPYVPIASTLRTGVSVLSYCGGLSFGITADYDSNPDIDVLARGTEHGIAELVTASTRHREMRNG